MKKSEIQIFLAHANEDKEAVLELYEHLKRAGYTPWLDKKNLIPGQNWRSVISEVIAKSQLFIACLSSRSIAKQSFVQREFRMALTNAADKPPGSIYIIPIRLDKCEIPNLRQEEYGINLRDYHWLDYWEADGFDQLERAIAHEFGPFEQTDEGQARYFSEDLGNGVKLDMVAIPDGKFMMGSPEDEGNDWEKPLHEVTIQPFFMGKYPITQAQYRRVMGKNPSRFQGDDRPVERVSWDDAVEFCQTLSNQTGKEYRLPSEAEWEYACRAGTTTRFYFGGELNENLANYGSNVNKTTPVGSFPPNAFGLYDMHGNVWEWCADTWHDNYEGAPTDGSAWNEGGDDNRSPLRGGSWLNRPEDCRSASRIYVNRRDLHVSNLGFRVVCGFGRT